jgi:CrcB protein
MSYVLAALGGALGALARWSVATALPSSPRGWPWATLAVNLAGCVLVGVLLAVALARWPDSPWVRPFLAVGFLGGFTTFSAFAVETVLLAEAGAWPVATGYVLVSVVGGPAGVLLGLLAARAALHLADTVLAELEAGEDQT